MIIGGNRGIQYIYKFYSSSTFLKDNGQSNFVLFFGQAQINMLSFMSH